MKKENIDVTQAIIKVDLCGITYKGEKLEMGDSKEKWIKVLGKPSRKLPAFGEKNQGISVWDDLGVAIDNFQNENGTVAFLYIFFLNLDSPDANEQMLNHARDWESGEHIAARNMKGGKSLITEEQVKKFNRENALKKKEYIYPFKVYQGVVDLHGFPVKKGMKIKEINSYRGNNPSIEKFGYVDDDIDGVNDSGNTTKTFGGDYRAPGNECKEGRLQYYEVTYTATQNLEYLKIGYESKEEFEGRKQMQADYEQRIKKEKSAK
ncbi:hypothetical protein IV494_00080 [Kaistella sp. G5-32]|uniref:DUF7738 domain-containing protein n=1 Tax=Kaistella gelatinilytica TaxID=2787636 RepID=A0ABS0F7D1_9FLAO|nr:hypothetical protein [Kaistella gelatinilytica]MBF8455565.1 hypothetical protein [Kaistella gelatinilytica]